MRSQVSAATVPTDPYGVPDACAAGMTSVTPVSILTPTNATAFTRLPAYFPFMVSITATDAGGAVSPRSHPHPFFYARAMPPGWEDMGLWLDARTLPPGKLAMWADSSPSGRHDFIQKQAAYQPTARAAASGVSGSSGAVAFTRAAGTVMEGGADAIDLGISTDFSTYIVLTQTQGASSQFVVNRGNLPSFGFTGWSWLSFVSTIAPFLWPGAFGVRTTDYNMATAGATVPVTTLGVPMTYAAVAAPGVPNGKAFAPHNLAVAVAGDMSGSMGAFLTAGATMLLPVAVDYTTLNGTAKPVINNYLQMRLGSMGNGDSTRGFDGDVYGVLTFRAAHNNATLAAVSAWLDSYYHRTCPTPMASPNATGTGNCGASAATGASCGQACASGYAAVAGSVAHTCNGGTWSGAALLCRRTCPALAAPVRWAACERTAWDEAWGWNAPDVFTGPSVAPGAPSAGANKTALTSLTAPTLYPYAAFPPVPDTERARLWAVDAAAGVLRATTSDACAHTAASTLGIMPDGWDIKVPTASTLRATTRVAVASGSVAGVTVRLVDANNGYRLTLAPDSGTGVTLALVSGGAVTPLAVDAGFPVDADAWYVLDVTVVGATLTAVITPTDAGGAPSGASTTLTALDGTLTWGAVGLYASGVASFDYLTVRTSCDAGGGCVGLAAGAACTYSCASGYAAVGTGTFDCGDGGEFAGGVVCAVTPPTMANQTGFTIPEHAAAGTPAAPAINATAPNPLSAVTFSVVAQWPFNDTFSVGFCSGELLAANPARLDVFATGVQEHYVTVAAMSDGEPAAVATATMTVTVTEVDDPPYFPALPTLTADENWWGALSPAVTAVDPEGDTLTYSIVWGNSDGVFAIDPDTAVLSILPPGLNYEASPTRAVMVRAAQVNNPAAAASATVTVAVVDVNDAPTTWPQAFMVDEMACGVGAAVGTVAAADADTNPLWNVLTFAITVNEMRAGAPALAIASSTGALTFAQTFKYGASAPVYVVDGMAVKDVFNVTVRACDNGGRCAAAPALVYVTPNATVQVACQVQAVNARPHATNGGELVTFTGTNFVTGASVAATYTNQDGRRYTATGCSVPGVNTLRCYTVAGYGATLTWSISMGGSPCTVAPAAATAYAAPAVTGVAYTTSTFQRTTGGRSVVVTGTNFGPTGTPVSVSFGAWKARTASVSIAHTRLSTTTGEGCGANLSAVVTVGATAATAARSAPSNGTYSYSGPGNAGLYYWYLYTSLASPYVFPTSVPALGGLAVPLQTTDYFLGPNNPAASLTVTAYSAYLNTSVPIPCVRATGTAAHSRATCTLPAGVGKGWQISLNVCGQQAPPCAVSGICQYQTLGFAAPVVTGVGGPGARGASTEGGQVVTLSGREFGPLWSATGAPPGSISPIDSVQVGTTASGGRWLWNMSSCAVTSTVPPQITCLSGPGYGAGYALRLSMGGTAVVVTPSPLLGYGNPVVASFSGGGAADADTSGLPYPGGTVVLSGANFGAVWGPHITINYTTSLVTPRATDGGLPGVNGTVTLLPTNCSMPTPHRALSCNIVPGAGAGYTWTVTVAGLRNTEVTTWYGAPILTTLTPLSGRTSVAAAGGEAIAIDGANLGPASFVQAVTYGPTGVEYAALNWTSLSHTRLVFVTAPGVGLANRVAVTVGDQTTITPDYLTFDYDPPVITSVTPAAGFATADPRRPALVTVTGTNFGLASGAVDVVVGFGNVADASMVVLPVVSRLPSAAPGQPEAVTFAQPSGLGPLRGVRVFPYLRALGVPLADAVARVNVSGVSDVFSYYAPSVASVSVAVVNEGSPEEDECAAAGVCVKGDYTPDTRQLVLVGPGFGPSANATGDSIGRVVEVRADGSAAWEATPTVGYVDTAWTQSVVTAYTVQATGEVRVRVNAKDPWGGDVSQATAPLPYTALSPEVGALVGSTVGLPTAGGTVIGVPATNLFGGSTFNVTVGGVSCTLLDGPAGAPVPPADVLNRLILNGSTSFPPGYVWTLWAVVPPGQGVDVPVVMVRDASPSNGSAVLSYAPPALTVWRTCSAPGVCGAPVGLPPDGLVSAPTIGGRLRVEGTNLGLCPIVFVGAGYVEACIVDPASPNPAAPAYMPNPAVLRSHTFVEFPVPAGEGAAPPGAPVGTWYSLVLDVGGQSPTGLPPRFTYDAPIVTSITPGVSGTRGGGVVAVTGVNFGLWATPVVELGDDVGGVPWQACGAVVRFNHTALNCTLPAGVGGSLAVRVSVANLTGVSAAPLFAYDPPTLTSVMRTYSGPSAMVAPRNATPAVATATVPGGSLRGDPAGGYTLTLVGTNFGPAAAAHMGCAFVSWPSRAPPGTLVCDGWESFFGEGEVAAANVSSWDHETVVFTMPPGVGNREVTVRVGGQAPAASLTTWHYEDPVVTGYEAAAPVVTRGGTPLTLTGYYLPRPFWNASQLAFPLPLPLDASHIMPTQQLVVSFGLPGARSHKCATSALWLDGHTPQWLDGCAAGTVSGQSDTGLTVATPAGVGRGRPLQVQIVDYGVVVAASGYVNYSYAAPTITYMEPSPLYMPVDSAGFLVRLRGDNFGSLLDAPSWDGDQLQLSVAVDDVPCTDATRLMLRDGTEAVQCATTSGLVVGHKSTNVSVAYQTGFLNYTSASSILAVCRNGTFGAPGETCLACMAGAACPGFTPDPPFTPTPSPDGGTHAYPIALPTFYNLAGAEAAACPPEVRAQLPTRDVCIVGCQPPEACLGANACAPGYESQTPYYRCASCAAKYYRYGGDCLKCPDSPAALFIGFGLILLTVAAAGFLLLRKGVNIAFLSIGIDFFQVLSIFANAKVAWPAALKDLWRILSAFNLNIEIVAPECLVAGVTFQDKWKFVMAAPLVLAGVFGAVHGCAVAYKRWWLRQKKWEVLLSHMDVLIAAFLILFYIAYLYLTQQVLSVFNCGPTDPPDGRSYLLATFEDCDAPGGTHRVLTPAAVVALLGYTMGYPAALAVLFYRNREALMEDQLLRAKGVGGTKLTNPHALWLRRRFARTYYQFRPALFFWVLVILARKLALAVTALMFRRSAAFQLAAALLIMFLAYAAQVRFVPYMSPGDYDDVLAEHKRLALTSPLHARLQATLSEIEGQGRKRTRSTLLTPTGRVDARAVAGAVGAWLFNYNTVEVVLLFAAVIVCLMGIMFQATASSSFYFASSREGISAVVIAVITIAITYFATVVMVDIMTQLAAAAAVRAPKKGSDSPRPKSRRGGALHGGGGGGERETELARMAMRAADSGVVNVGKVEATMNPMFLTKAGASAAADGSGGGGGDDLSLTAQAHTAIMGFAEPPPLEMWMVFRDSYGGLYAQVQALSAQLGGAKKEAQKMRDVLVDLGMTEMPDGSLSPGAALALTPRAGGRVATTRAEFAPTAAAGGGAGGGGAAGGDEPAPSRPMSRTNKTFGNPMMMAPPTEPLSPRAALSSVRKAGPGSTRTLVAPGGGGGGGGGGEGGASAVALVAATMSGTQLASPSVRRLAAKASARRLAAAAAAATAPSGAGGEDGGGATGVEAGESERW